MGGATGGMRGTCPPPPVRSSWRDVPPEIAVFKVFFRIFAKIFGFSSIFKIKWAKSEKKSDFGGWWF